jgi:hypothetical protein
VPSADLSTERLLEATTRLAPALRVDHVLAIMADIGREALGADYTGIGLLDERDVIRLPAPLNWDRPGPVMDIALSEDSLVAGVLRDGQPVYLDSPDAYLALVRSARTRELVAAIDEKSWAVLPLRTTAAPFGVLRLAFRTPRVLAAGERVFLEALAGQCALAVERARLFEREHDAVVLLQRSLLPTAVPPTPGLQVACRYLPGRESAGGGDWYDVFPLPAGRFALVVGDVMGHGLAAASVMGQVRGALRAFALGDPDPATVFTGLDRFFAMAEDPETLTTCVYGVIDPATGWVVTANAGHMPWVLARSDGPVELLADDPAGTPLGWSEPRAAGRQFRLAPGDLLLGFTDGLVESRTRSLDVGLTVVMDAVGQARELSVADVCDHLQSSLLDGRRHDDDVTLLVARLDRTPDAPDI